MTVSIGGLSLRRAAGRPEPDERRILVREQRVAERPPDELGLRREVDLVAAEVEQLGVDDRQAGLAAGLGGDARDQVAGQDQLGLVAADQRGRRPGSSGRGSRPRCGTARAGGAGGW